MKTVLSRTTVLLAIALSASPRSVRPASSLNAPAAMRSSRSAIFRVQKKPLVGEPMFVYQMAQATQKKPSNLEEYVPKKTGDRLLDSKEQQAAACLSEGIKILRDGYVPIQSTSFQVWLNRAEAQFNKAAKLVPDDAEVARQGKLRIALACFHEGRDMLEDNFYYGITGKVGFSAPMFDAAVKRWPSAKIWAYETLTQHAEALNRSGEHDGAAKLFELAQRYAK